MDGISASNQQGKMPLSLTSMTPSEPCLVHHRANMYLSSTTTESISFRRSTQVSPKAPPPRRYKSQPPSTQQRYHPVAPCELTESRCLSSSSIGRRRPGSMTRHCQSRLPDQGGNQRSKGTDEPSGRSSLDRGHCRGCQSSLISRQRLCSRGS